MTTATIEDRVQAGAAFLDSKVPNWRGRIDIETLDIALPTQCVMGQMYGMYSTGVHHLLAAPDMADQARAYGFNVEQSSPLAQVEEYRDLTYEWKRELQAA